eukprot:scaffold10118_cov19-Prasinocladus_malaysianus.AAC.2
MEKNNLLACMLQPTPRATFHNCRDLQMLLRPGCCQTLNAVVNCVLIINQDFKHDTGLMGNVTCQAGSCGCK